MSIEYRPLGLPVSTSFAQNTTLALFMNPSNLPISTSYAEYSQGNVGPQGETYKTISGSKVIIINV